MLTAGTRLAEIETALRSGHSPDPVRVRELLGWFDHQRPGFWVVRLIWRELDEHNLVTHPDFNLGHIDSDVRFTLVEESDQPSDERDETVDNSDLDATYRVGRLPAANSQPVFGDPDAPLATVVTNMLVKGLTHVVVANGPCHVLGVISLSGIGRRLACDLTPMLRGTV